MNDVAVAFRDADGPMTEALVQCLDFMNRLPCFEAYKRQSFASLGVAAGGAYLDVACGVGFDAAALAGAFPDARFVGVDKCRAFVDRARARAAGVANVSYVEGEADRLPFPDGAFRGARIDRSLQHMTDPAAALAEMARVVAEGGRIVAAEPDWGTFFLYDGAVDIGARMAAKWLESIRNPFIGRELGALFDQCGLVEFGLRAHPLALTRLAEADVVYDLARLAENCVAASVLSPQEARDWRRNADAATSKGTFLAHLTIIERWGVVRTRS